MRALVALALLGGCNKQERAVTQAAETLCTWGQLDNLQLNMLPESAGLEPLVRDADLRWAKDKAAEKAAAPTDNNPLAALGQALVDSVVAMGRATVEASAKHARCDVTEVTIEGERATVQLSRSVPDISDPGKAEDRLAEMRKLDSHEARVALLDELMDEASARKESTHTLTFLRQGEAWVIDYGLPEKKIDAIIAEQVELKKAVEEAEEAEEVLEQVKVVKAALGEQRKGLWVDTTFTLGLENGTPHTFSAATLEASWAGVEPRSFELELPEPLASGGSGEWTLTGNAFRALAKAEHPPEAALQVSVRELRGPDGEALVTVKGKAADERRLVEKAEEIEAIREKYL
ncbi:MAG: hypothetical protein H6739_11085 [Alphaproteobacteria bacterium]|nr:hypothetical protein [Alphaproteobacteria bacterium]